MKKLILLSIFFAAIFTSCQTDDTINATGKNIVGENVDPTWFKKHDAVPVAYLGQWVEQTDKQNPVITVTETNIIIDRTKEGQGYIEMNYADFYTVNTEGNFGIYYNNNIYQSVNISLGKGDYSHVMTLTIDGECITKLTFYVPTQEPPKEEPVIIPAA